LDRGSDSVGDLREATRGWGGRDERVPVGKREGEDPSVGGKRYGRARRRRKGEKEKSEERKNELERHQLAVDDRLTIESNSAIAHGSL